MPNCRKLELTIRQQASIVYALDGYAASDALTIYEKGEIIDLIRLVQSADILAVEFAGTPEEKQHDEVCYANARMIQAAPSMYEALDHVEAVMSIVQPRGHTKEYLETLGEVRAALAIARGETK